MTLDIPAVRPAIIGPKTANDLRRLLAFRHFLRNAYAVELDPAELQQNRAAAIRLETPLNQDLDRLEKWLEELLESA